MLWAVARNASGRPTLQHAVEPADLNVTVPGCNLYIAGWSRHYSSQPIAAIACKRCLKATGTVANPIRARHPLHLVSQTGT